MIKHKNYKNVWELPPSFPNIEVISAFSKPNVNSPKKIKFGSPDFKNIEIFCREILKLKPHEIEYIIEPIKSEYLKRKDQPKITKYFDRGSNLGSIVSSRLLDSVSTLIKNQKKGDEISSSEPENDSEGVKKPSSGAMEEESLPGKKKGKARAKKAKKVKKITGAKKEVNIEESLAYEDGVEAAQGSNLRRNRKGRAKRGKQNDEIEPIVEEKDEGGTQESKKRKLMPKGEENVDLDDGKKQKNGRKNKKGRGKKK